MRTAPTLFAVVTLTLSGPTVSGPAAVELPRGPWELTVCEGTASTGSTCAHLDQTLKLQVRYVVGPADMGKVLFEEKISPDLAQQLFARGLAAIRAFGQVAQGSVETDGEFFMVQVEANGHKASVQFLALTAEDSGPEMNGLAGLLSQTTHAF